MKYLATFIFHLTEHIVVLDELVSKEFDKIFPKWSQKHQNIFEKIKQIVTEAKYLTMIDYNSRENIYIITNTSSIGTRTILSVGNI